MHIGISNQWLSKWKTFVETKIEVIMSKCCNGDIDQSPYCDSVALPGRPTPRDNQLLVSRSSDQTTSINRHDIRITIDRWQRYIASNHSGMADKHGRKNHSLPAFDLSHTLWNFLQRREIIMIHSKAVTIKVFESNLVTFLVGIVLSSFGSALSKLFSINHISL